MAVAVDVQGQGGEVVVIRPLSLDVADVVRRPRRALIPRVARDDVELAVVVDVEGARGLELALAVDRVRLPLRIVRPGGCAQGEDGDRAGGEGSVMPHGGTPGIGGREKIAGRSCVVGGTL